MDSAVYRQVMGEKAKGWNLPHHSEPCHNLISSETMHKLSKNESDSNLSKESNHFFKDFPLYKPFGYDVRCSLAFYCGSGKTDVATKLIKIKSKWEKQLEEISIKNTKQCLESLKKFKNSKSVKLSNDTQRLIEIFKKDPEPKFNGNYNWLFAGGNITKVETQDNVYLISADYLNKTAGLCTLKLNESLDKINSKHFNPLKSSLPILQVCGKAKDDNVLLFVRQKNKATLFNCNNDCDLTQAQNLWTKNFAKPELLTYLDINSSLREVLLSDTNNEVKVFDTETQKKTFGLKFRKSSDSCRDAWNQVVFGDFGLYACFRDYLFVLDTRDSDSAPRLAYSPSAILNSCEEISSVTKSACDPNYLYLSTTHSLVQMDLRNGKTVQRWTHLMNNSPLMVQCTRNNDTDFLLLQSHKIDELVGITNEYITTEDDAYYRSESLPLLLKSIKESLKLARFSGLCLNPCTAQRFDFAVTGAEHLKRGEDILYFTANSGGDIFLTKIRKKDDSSPEKDSTAETEILTSMTDYNDHFENFYLSDIDHSSVEVVDMTAVLEELKKPGKKHKKYVKPEMDWKYHETFAPESLAFYRDVLAQKVLKAWGFNVEDLELNDTFLSSEAKVIQWMQSL